MKANKVDTDVKRFNVPLEEALDIAGTGRYTIYVIIASGLLLFSVILDIQSISMVLPVAGCDLNLTSAEKGTLNSIIFAGMVFSGPLAGFLSDAYGRKRVSFCGVAVSSVLGVLCSLAPNTSSLMVLCFINGIALTGALTPAYVIVSEFSPIAFRPKVVIICATISVSANIYLPGMALMVMPLEIDLQIFGMFNFSSWRLFLLIITIPKLVALFLMWKVPETPKFLLNQGLSDLTLEVLKSIYAINQKKKKEEFPVLSVILDPSDADCRGSEGDTSTLMGSIKQMKSRTCLLFSRSYLLNTVISSVMLFTLVGVYNIYILWFPEQLSRIKHYSYSNHFYNMTLCDLMSSHSNPILNETHCQLNYDFFSYCIMLGMLQVPIGAFASIYAARIGKKLLLIGILLVVASFSSISVYLNMEYIIIVVLVSMIIMMGVAFPLGLTFILEYYPTYVRSTAGAVTMISGRLGAAAGSQIMGLLFDNYCEEAYWGISVITAVTAILCLMLPSKKKF